MIVLMSGCSSASSSGPGATSNPARQAELVTAATAVGPVTSGWSAVQTSSICEGRPSCTDPSVSFVSRRKGGTPQQVCAEAAPWVARSFGVAATVEDCVRAMTGPADSTTTQPGFQWHPGVTVADVDGSPATWQISVIADEVDGGQGGPGTALVPLSYQAGGYLYDGDRAADIARLTGVSPSPS